MYRIIGIRTRTRFYLGQLDLAVSLGILVGLILPIAAALLYRTYALSMSPAWFEITRQLGLPFVFAEIGIVAFANRRGFDILALVKGLPPFVRRTLMVFLATFWISSVFVASAATFATALCLVWVLHLCAGAAIYHLTRTTRMSSRRFARGFALGLAALSPIIVAHLAFPPRDAGVSTWIFGAPIPGFISIRLFGAWTGSVLALLLGIAWRVDEEGAAPLWLYPAIALAAGLSFWSGTRAVVFGVIVALALAAVLTRGGPAPRFWRRCGGATILGVVVVMLVFPNIGQSLMDRNTAMTSADGFTSGRLELWTRTLAVAIHRPFFGHGMGSNWWLVSLDGIFHVQPHNALVEFAMNWGLIPTIPAVILLGIATWHVHIAARRHADLLPFVMMLDFLLAVSLVDGMLHFARFVMMITMLIGICLAHRDRPEDGHIRA